MLIDANLSQIPAIGKCPLANIGNGIRNIQFAQPRTVGKRTFINVGNVAKINFAEGLTAAENPAIDMRYTVRHMIICSDRTVCCT